MCTDFISVSGAEAVQLSKMGTYTKAGPMQGDRPVYQRVGSTMYLFYFPSLSEWRIGSNYTGSTSSLKSIGDATRLCPDEATGWQAAVTAGWDDTYPIIVAPIPTCNGTVAVSGAEAVQTSSMGTYTRVAGLMQGGRPVYQLVGTIVKYLFFWPGTSTGVWWIGSSYTTNAGTLKSAGSLVLCPDLASGWQASITTGWSAAGAYPITVVPVQTLAPTTAAPIDIGNQALALHHPLALVRMRARIRNVDVT